MIFFLICLVHDYLYIIFRIIKTHTICQIINVMILYIANFLYIATLKSMIEIKIIWISRDLLYFMIANYFPQTFCFLFDCSSWTVNVSLTLFKIRNSFWILLTLRDPWSFIFSAYREDLEMILFRTRKESTQLHNNF